MKMSVCGYATTPLTTKYSSKLHPAWWPDWGYIAFESDRSGNFEIYLMNADGSDQHPLTHTTADDYTPAWRP